VDHLVRNPAAAAAVERYCLFRADRIIVVVDEMAERMRRMGVSPDRIDVISNTPPRSRAEPAPHRSRGVGEPLELVYLGLLEIPRGLAELLDAVALLRDDGFPVRLTVVGTGRDAALFQAQAQRLRLAPPMVRFLGYVDRETALAAVEHADIGVLPHHRNEQWNTSMPNKLFDYMAVGLPVVTSDAIPCVRITRESGAGEVFEAGNAAALAAAIRRLGSAEARARCGAAGRDAVLERYNWECEAPVLLQSIARAVAAPVRLA
jgi:glycosyltransferase involved in cell wall biosynthesis